MHESVPTYTLDRARPQDVRELVSFLGAHVPEVSADTVWQVPWSWHRYCLARSDAGIVATGSLQPLCDRRAELRGIAVAASCRGRGLARTVVQTLVDQAAEEGLDAVCVTRHPRLFRSLGFEETHPSWLDLRRRPTPASNRSRVTMALVERRAA